MTRMSDSRWPPAKVACRYADANLLPVHHPGEPAGGPGSIGGGIAPDPLELAIGDGYGLTAHVLEAGNRCAEVRGQPRHDLDLLVQRGGGVVMRRPRRPDGNPKPYCLECHSWGWNALGPSNCSA